MFSDRLGLQIADAAKASGIPESGMLAIVEVETAGNPFEADGHTPQFLFERHRFYSELSRRMPDKLSTAVNTGLAIKSWSPSTQYKDQRTSQQKMELLARAKSIDEECALRSCSWGLPQLMGSECQEVGFPSAKSMVNFMVQNGIGGHLALMTKFLKARKLVGAIEAKDWAYVALRYNGAGYKKNQYDTRLAAGDKKWERKLPQLRAAGDPVDYPEQHLNREQVEQVQLKLRHLQYAEVGNPDGRWGDKTSAAVFAFQKHEGLPATGHFDDETRNALDEADARPVPEDRAKATLDDLRDQGSTTVAKADTTEGIGWSKVVTGGGVLTGIVVDAVKNPGTIDRANDAVDKAHQVKALWASVQDLLPTTPHLLLLVVAAVLVAGGIYVVLCSRGVKASRLLDFQTGIHAGTVRV